MTAMTYTVEQEMNVENDTLIITDPCYILKEEHWEHWLSMEFGSNPIGLDNYLRQYHNFGEVIAADTGYGDWSNEVYDSNTGAVLGEFSADAGMVIVCTASDLTNYGYDKDEVERLGDIGCLAVIPNFSGTVELHYEYNKDNNKLAVIYGMSKDEDEDFNTMKWASEEQD
jgi:hypothetical protein